MCNTKLSTNGQVTGLDGSWMELFLKRLPFIYTDMHPLSPWPKTRDHPITTGDPIPQLKLSSSSATAERKVIHLNPNVATVGPFPPDWAISQSGLRNRGAFSSDCNPRCNATVSQPMVVVLCIGHHRTNPDSRGANLTALLIWFTGRECGSEELSLIFIKSRQVAGKRMKETFLAPNGTPLLSRGIESASLTPSPVRRYQSFRTSDGN